MRKLTTEEFIKRAKEIHGDRYDYSKVIYGDMHSNVTIVCRKHGDFEQTPSNHLKGYGCAQCNRVEARQMDPEVFLQRARDVHDNKYDYSKVIYKNSRIDVEIICPVHGSFFQRPYKHLQGHGCPKCAPNYKDTKESFIEKARKVHGNKYDYSKVTYVDEHTKVCIVDPEYGEFWQQPNAHLSGTEHPGYRISKQQEIKRKNGHVNKQEETVYDLLCKKFGSDNVVREYWSEKYPFSCDFYVTIFDLYIEMNLCSFHCGHWFDPENDMDVAYLESLQEKAKTSAWYAKMVRVWSVVDLKRRDAAVSNHLNYLVFWKYNLSDFMKWYDSFDFNKPVLNNVSD